jgi:predicted ATPase/class 3 adenylate cyclase
VKRYMMSPNLPTGTITFFFSDIEASTQLWEKFPDAMRGALSRHDVLLQSAISSNNGHVIKTTGDGVVAVFASAVDAIVAVVTGQRALQTESWPVTGPVRSRMALHTGEAEMRDDDYFGTTLNRTARLMTVAAGGQVLISQTTADLVQDRLPAGIGLRDLGEHRLKDLVRPEHVYQVLAPDLTADFPPLKSLNAFPHNLPVQVTSFVGRENEIAESRRLLTTTRLLTLTGPGGTGKTRLALQLAAEALSATEFPDGVWLVELAPLADPSYLMPALAAVFGIREVPGRSLDVMVTDYLRGKALVLLLDNCEHLIDACARLADSLLRACPRLKILASSREALGLAGETAYHVPSLGLPDRQGATPEALLRSEAGRLFVERAQAAQPRFTLTAGNARAVASICARLDGIPLAIELAAARVKVLTAEQIAARLDDRFRLLVGGSRTALPRQQTLRALVDWSYDLLPDSECQLLQQLSVFAGGWGLEAAEAIGNCTDVLDVLTALVNKSLVLVDEGGSGAVVRFRLLETIRQYAREKLLESGEAAEARRRHLDYYLRMSEALEPRLKGPEMIACLDLLAIEQDNVRVALEWALENDPLAALRLVAALAIFWGRRTSISEGLSWVRAALTRADGETSQPYLLVVARALAAEASLTFELGDIIAARAASERCISMARQNGDALTLAMALGTGATACAFQGDVVTARAWAEESMAISGLHGYVYERGLWAGAHLFFALLADQAVPDSAREEALQTARATGNPWVIALATRNMAAIAAQQGQWAQAHAGFEEAAAIYQQMRERSFYVSTRSEIAHVLRSQGRLADAQAIYRETVRTHNEVGQVAAVAHELECFAFIAIATEQPERAVRLLGAAEALRASVRSQMILFERREYDQAVTRLRTQLHDNTFTAAWTEGRGMTIDAAINYAIASADASNSSSLTSQTA